MPNIRFRAGMKLPDFYCPYCDFKTEGTIYRERFEWLVRMKCGHNKILGMVLPPEELEARGLINQQTPEEKKRKSVKEQMILDGQLERKMIHERLGVLSRLTRGKRYL